MRVASLCIAVMACARHEAEPAPATKPARTQYLLFQTMTFGPALNGELMGMHVEQPASVTSAEVVRTQVQQIVATIGDRGNDTRKLGFAVGPLALDMTDDQLRTEIRYSFDIAETENVAVAFHIDDSMFWNRRTDLHANPENVEWSSWDRKPVPHRIIGWAAGGAPILAPPICYTSPNITTEITRIARDVIGSEIKKGVDHLASIGKPRLFAGVIAGWETRMQDDSSPPVTYGYCALHHLGYSASKPPADLDRAWQEVVSGWIVLWAKGLIAAGLPREQIFTHIGSPVDMPAAAMFSNPLRDFYKDSDPSVTAFNDSSRPGFSLYGHAFAGVHRIVNGSPWGISEGTSVALEDAFKGGTFTPSGKMEEYLGAAFNHGAAYVNVFGWSKTTDDAFAKEATSESSVAAYKKFLGGAALNE